MKTFNLPKYFTFSELVKTDSGKYNLPNDFQEVFNIMLLAYALDYIREHFGHTIIVNSAFRTKSVNEAVGGASESYHLQGLAADIRPMSVFARQLDSNISSVDAEQAFYQEFELLGSILLALKNDGMLIEYIPYERFFHITISDKFKCFVSEKMFNNK